MQSFSSGFTALVIGSTGGIGAGLVSVLRGTPDCAEVIGLSRRTSPALELTDETSIHAAMEAVKERYGQVDLIIDATGALDIEGHGPEKTIRAIDPVVMARQFAVNAIGPALLFKHFSTLLPRDRKSVFATLSARVGSIGDNRLGGWISYRASKAALNQIVRTSAIEIARTRPHSVVVAMHPGTVDTALGAGRNGNHQLFSPAEAAEKIVSVIDRLTPAETGGFFAYDGAAIEW